MRGEIVLINQVRAMAAAKTEEGEFVIFELLGGHNLEIGDIISHPDFSSMGGEEYINKTQNERMDVYVQNLCGSLQQAKQLCFL
jgi:hypothetical protein